MKSTEETRALAQEVLDYIHAHPEQHDQGSTGMCGTTMCIAGTAAFLEWGVNAERVVYDEYGGMTEACGPLLGLEPDEAEFLFFEMMDEEGAVQLLKQVIVGEPLSIPSDYYSGDSG